MIYDIIMLQNYTHKLWEEFADEVIRKNDFPVESELLVKIKEISEYAECVIEKGTLLYGSREYTQDDFMRNAQVKKISEQQAPFWALIRKYNNGYRNSNFGNASPDEKNVQHCHY